MKKSPNPVDTHVGSRVRMRRLMLDMSQEKLGGALGLTFQQVQKYEKGTNRVGASRLQHISSILQVPISFFFEGAPTLPGQAWTKRRFPPMSPTFSLRRMGLRSRTPSYASKTPISGGVSWLGWADCR